MLTQEARESRRKLKELRDEQAKKFVQQTSARRTQPHME